MKINLKLSCDITLLICKLYDQYLESEKQIFDSSFDYKQFRAICNLMESFINKMKKKLIDKQTQKDFKMNFQYYEAYFLQIFINRHLDQFNPLEYNRTILFNLYLKIDEKLR